MIPQGGGNLAEARSTTNFIVFQPLLPNILMQGLQTFDKFSKVIIYCYMRV
jgi:hypothetical protein